MAFDGDVQPTRLARAQAGKLLFQGGDARQDVLGQAQQLHPRRRQAHRLGPAHEQAQAGLVLQALDLVAQRALRDVQPIRRAGQSAFVVDRLDRAQVAKLDMHARLM